MSIVLYRTVVCHMQFFKWGVSFTHCNDIIGTLFPPNFRYFFPSSEQRWEHLLFLWWLDSLVYSSFFEECFLKTLLRGWMGNMHLLKRSIITVACVSPLKYCLFCCQKAAWSCCLCTSMSCGVALGHLTSCWPTPDWCATGRPHLTHCSCVRRSCLRSTPDVLRHHIITHNGNWRC